MHASLPVRCGGLGVSSAVQLTPYAFLSSVARPSDLVCHTISSDFSSVPYPEADAALSVWSQAHSNPPPVALASFTQKAWDDPGLQTTLQFLLGSASDDSSRARLLAAYS